ncbi:hypothetical protein [Alteromonas sp. 14N.309.X.WAT.G.H12]|uniref:hypothetical protein n=1 Tax=Alteromonas sp. 14N.309.X.WAT.G.H12 TaxID=3120824 RepID=UPI002FD6F74B
MKSVFSFRAPSAVPMVKPANRLQLVAGLALLSLAAMCLYLATRYYQFSSLSSSSHKAFVAAVMDNKKPANNLDVQIAKLRQLHRELPKDGSVALALAEVYAMQGLGSHKPHNTGALAMRYVLQAEDMQPTHYEAFAVKMAITELFASQEPIDIKTLERGLVLAPFEWETQSIIGPVLIAHWYELPPSIKQKAKPVIQSALRQKPTRERLIAIMENTRIVTPFMGLSPGKWITERLQRIEQNVTNTDV